MLKRFSFYLKLKLEFRGRFAQHVLFIVKFSVIMKTKETNALLQHNNLSLQTVEKYKRNISSLQKKYHQRSRQHPRYMLLTLLILLSLFIQTALHYLDSSRYAYRYCQERLERYWNGMLSFSAKNGVTGQSGWVDTPQTVMTTRLEICQKIYTTGFSGQKFYTLKMRKL